MTAETRGASSAKAKEGLFEYEVVEGVVHWGRGTASLKIAADVARGLSTLHNLQPIGFIHVREIETATLSFSQAT